MKRAAARAPGRVAAALAAFLMTAGYASARDIAAEELDCLIDAHSRVKVSASVPGVVERIHADRGDRVRSGQVIVELESSVEQAQLALAKARAANDQTIQANRTRLDLAQKKAERLRRLRQANPGALTEVQWDDTMTELQLAMVNLRDAELTQDLARLEAARAEAQLNQRRIVSPTDGIVTERLLAEGEYRHEQAQFMTIARINPLHVEVFVPIALYGQVRLGGTATIMPEQPVGGRHRATVSIVDRVLDAASGTFGVRLLLANPDFAIPAGLRCRIRFDAGGAAAN